MIYAVIYGSSMMIFIALAWLVAMHQRERNFWSWCNIFSLLSTKLAPWGQQMIRGARITLEMYVKSNRNRHFTCHYHTSFGLLSAASLEWSQLWVVLHYFASEIQNSENMSTFWKEKQLHIVHQIIVGSTFPLYYNKTDKDPFCAASNFKLYV